MYFVRKGLAFSRFCVGSAEQLFFFILLLLLLLPLRHQLFAFLLSFQEVFSLRDMSDFIFFLQGNYYIGLEGLKQAHQKLRKVQYYSTMSPWSTIYDLIKLSPFTFENSSVDLSPPFFLNLSPISSKLFLWPK